MPCLQPMLSQEAHKEPQLIRASRLAHQANLLCQDVLPLLSFLQLSSLRMSGKRGRCQASTQAGSDRDVAIKLKIKLRQRRLHARAIRLWEYGCQKGQLL